MKNDELRMFALVCLVSMFVLVLSIGAGLWSFDRQFVPVDTSGMSQDEIELLERWME